MVVLLVYYVCVCVQCLDVLLDGSQEAAVINAETGSGKTFCKLRIIINYTLSVALITVAQV